MTYANDPEFCGEGECFDGILGAEVARRLVDIQSDTVLVLHQIGSHGPSYYLRYPQAFGDGFSQLAAHRGFQRLHGARS